MKADLAAHGFDELRGVVADAVLEDDLNLFDVFDIGRGVSLQHDDVGGFARSQRANFIELAEEFGAVRSGDVMASSGVKPASTRSSTSRWSPNPAITPPYPVGSSPARSKPPRLTNSRSNSSSFLKSAGQNEVAA